jgi:putative transposase
LIVESVLEDLSASMGTRRACAQVGVARPTWFRHRQPPEAEEKIVRVRIPPSRALNPDERQAVLDVLHAERFCDMSVREVYATLLDEGRYLASVPTMYRILRSVDEAHERRRIAVHPPKVKPELVATAPRQVWSWDITKLLGRQKWTYYYLYVILDIYSRYVVGWLLADRESKILARYLFADTTAREGILPHTLTIHADRGSSMTSKPVAFLFADLGITRSHSRPHVSNDNPYSESQFKTMKYRPNFPDRFDSIEQARMHCREFFAWYNDDHHHTGLGLMTPADVHHGRTEVRREARRGILHAAYEIHPERFVHGRPEPLIIPEAAYINRPNESKVP